MADSYYSRDGRNLIWRKGADVATGGQEGRLVALGPDGKIPPGFIAATDDALIAQRPACGRLSNLGGSNPFATCHFVPFNGNKIPIAGYLYEIPSGSLASSGGVQATYSNCSIDKVTGQSLLANTTYWIYLYWNGTHLVLDFSRHSHVTSVVDGVEVKVVSGVEDRSCTLVGLCHTDASSKTQGGGNAQTIVSWFNRLTYPIFDNPNGTVLRVDYPTFKKLPGVAAVCFIEWVTWADYFAPFTLTLNAQGTTAGDNLDVVTSWDGSAGYGVHAYYNVPSPANVATVSLNQEVGNTRESGGGEGRVRIEVLARCSGTSNIAVNDGRLMAFVQV